MAPLLTGRRALRQHWLEANTRSSEAKLFTGFLIHLPGEHSHQRSHQVRPCPWTLKQKSLSQNSKSGNASWGRKTLPNLDPSIGFIHMGHSKSKGKLTRPLELELNSSQGLSPKLLNGFGSFTWMYQTLSFFICKMGKPPLPSLGLPWNQTSQV